MKHYKFFGPLRAALFVLLALLACTVPALGQVDLFGGPRTVALAPATMISATCSNVMDVSMFKGVAKLDLTCATNSGATVTGTLVSSKDLTNWTAVSYALATSKTYVITNRSLMSGTNGTLYGTNAFLLPGTVVTPTGATDGFTTAYLSSAPFTNVAAITMTGSGTWSVGFNADDVGRYVSVLWTVGGSGGAAVSATLTGRANYIP